jgi:hypothetical protein
VLHSTMSAVMSTHCEPMQSCLSPQSVSDEQVRGLDDLDVATVWGWTVFVPAPGQQGVYAVDDPANRSMSFKVSASMPHFDVQPSQAKKG